MTAACCIIAMNMNENVDVTMHKNMAVAYDYAVIKVRELYPNRDIYCFDDVREISEEESLLVEIRDINVRTLEVLEL
jgi:hypothetical protein